MESQFAEWLQEELDNRGWSQADLSRRANVSSAQISRVASGLRQPGNDLCLAVARAFNYSPESVFRIAGILPPEEDEEDIPDLWELNEIFKNASAEERQEMLEYVRWRAQKAREEEQRANRRRPGTAEA